MADVVHISRGERYAAECGAGGTISVISSRWVAKWRDQICPRCLAIHVVQQRPARSPLAWLRRHVEVLAVRRRIRAGQPVQQGG